MEAVAEQIRRIAPDVLVRCAYLELTTPDLPASAAELVDLGVNTITILPLFLGVGKHAREDLPHLVAALQSSYPHINFQLKPTIGEDPQVIALMAQIAIS